MVECWTLICSKFNGENADHLLIDWWIIVRLSLKWPRQVLSAWKWHLGKWARSEQWVPRKMLWKNKIHPEKNDILGGSFLWGDKPWSDCPPWVWALDQRVSTLRNCGPSPGAAWIPHLWWESVKRCLKIAKYWDSPGNCGKSRKLIDIDMQKKTTTVSYWIATWWFPMGFPYLCLFNQG